MTFEITGNKIPDGQYTAILLEVKEEQGQYGKQRKWDFAAEVPNGESGQLETQTITGLTSANTGPQSKAYAWLSGIEGRPLKAGEKVDPIGKRCILTVAANDKGFATIQAISPYVEPQQVLPGVPR